LFLSQGIPMLVGGDELGRTQHGNNNAYCQDNEISWIDWEHVDRDLLPFVGRLIQLRNQHPVFRRRGWFKGRPLHGAGVGDIGWFRPDGQEMSDQDWNEGFAKSLAVFLNGDALRDIDAHGHPVRDDSFLLLFNADHESHSFTMPAASFGARWTLLVNSTSAMSPPSTVVLNGEAFEVAARSMAVFSRPSESMRQP
jgi:glycogen operon protein